MGDASGAIGGFVDEGGNALSGADVTSAIGQSVLGDPGGQAGQIIGGSPDQGFLIGSGLEGQNSTLAQVGAGADTTARIVGASIGGGFVGGAGGAAAGDAAAAGGEAATVPIDVLGPVDAGAGAAATVPADVLGPVGEGAAASAGPVDVVSGASQFPVEPVTSGGTSATTGATSAPASLAGPTQATTGGALPASTAGVSGSGAATPATVAPALSEQNVGTVLSAGGGGPATTATPGLGSVTTGDELQQELTASGINATGSNAAGASTVANVAGPGSIAANAPTAAPGILGSGITGREILAGASLIGPLAQIAQGPGKLPSAVAPLTPGGAVTGPLTATETQQLNEANTGQLTPGQAAQVAQFRQRAEAQLYQQLANEGVADPRSDSRFIAGMAEIDQQSQIMSQQFVTAALDAGLKAAGGATSALGAAATAQLNQDNEFQAALTAAFQGAGNLAGAFGGAGGVRLVDANGNPLQVTPSGQPLAA